MENITSPLEVLDRLSMLNKAGTLPAECSFVIGVAKRALSGMVLLHDLGGCARHSVSAFYEALVGLAKVLTLMVEEHKEGEVSRFEVQLAKALKCAEGAFSALKGVVATPDKTLKHHAKWGLLENSSFLAQEIQKLLSQRDFTLDQLKALLPEKQYANKVLVLQGCKGLSDEVFTLLAKKFPLLVKLDVSNTDVTREQLIRFKAQCPYLSRFILDNCPNLKINSTPEVQDFFNMVKGIITSPVVKATLIKASEACFRLLLQMAVDRYGDNVASFADSLFTGRSDSLLGKVTKAALQAAAKGLDEQAKKYLGPDFDLEDILTDVRTKKQMKAQAQAAAEANYPDAEEVE